MSKKSENICFSLCCCLHVMKKWKTCCLFRSILTKVSESLQMLRHLLVHTEACQISIKQYKAVLQTHPLFIFFFQLLLLQMSVSKMTVSNYYQVSLENLDNKILANSILKKKRIFSKTNWTHTFENFPNTTCWMTKN